MLKSNKGFYIGDICYVFNDEIYDGFWGCVHDYASGEYHDVLGSGYSFAVGNTAWGDGEYKDQFYNAYYVDSGTIGIVPLELIEMYGDEEKLLDGGQVFELPGEALFKVDKGVFEIHLPNRKVIVIDTLEEMDDEEEDYWEEDEEEDY